MKFFKEKEDPMDIFANLIATKDPEEIRAEGRFAIKSLIVIIIIGLTIKFATNLDDIKDFWLYFSFGAILYFCFVNYLQEKKQKNFLKKHDIEETKEIEQQKTLKGREIIKSFLEQFFVKQQKNFFEIICYPLLLVIYKANFSKNKKEKFLYQIIEVIVFIVFYILLDKIF